jgi:hypothetical protein
MRKYLPSWLNALIWFSLVVSSLGLFIGLIVFATTKPMIDMSILEFDSWERYEASINNLLRLFAYTLLIVSPYTIVASLLSRKGEKMAWVMFLILFSLGTMISIYLMYQVVVVMIESQLFTFPTIPIFLVVASSTGLAILLRSDTKQFYAGLPSNYV